MLFYVYKELQNARQIRILMLAPGFPPDPLRGTLQHTSLDLGEPYEALSYVWGSDNKCQTLETPEGVLAITASLHSALKRLRLSESSRGLWADALCINQEDNKEKSHQVRLMYEIYTNATRVLAYLGDKADGSKLTLPLLEEMSSDTLFSSEPAGLLAFKGRSLRPVAALIRRPWFRRAWIIQEFVAAKDVVMVCGAWEMHWKVLHRAIENTFSFGELSLNAHEPDRSTRSLTSQGAIAMSTLEMARDLRKDGSRSYSSLLDLFELFKDKEATRTRDHIFSLLALASDADDSAFDPDYEEPLDVVVRRYAGVFVRRKQLFHLLASAGLSKKPSRFPSWIPDWTAKRKSRFSEGLADNHASCKAAGSTTEQAYFDEGEDELIVRGRFVDKLVRVLQFWNDSVGEDNEIYFESQTSYLQQSDDLIRSISTYPTGEDLLSVQWRTLIGDRDHAGNEFDASDSHALHSSYLAFRKRLADAINNKAPQKPHSQEAECDGREENTDHAVIPSKETYSKNFEYVFTPLTRHVTFSLTQRGYVGLVPKSAIPGDRICVLYGCPVPFVIRKSDLRERQVFWLVGKCYVHGIMDGEALSSESFTEQDIRLH